MLNVMALSPSYVLFSCDSYKSSILSGFSKFQEQQEFVDLTLAAEGHFVKVHKNVMALASPYLKGMIQSTSSHNPVIFLNNVSYTILTYLLEYIYQGEVSVPEDSIEGFLQVAMSLKIYGMDRETTTKATQLSGPRIAQDKMQVFALHGAHNKMVIQSGKSDLDLENNVNVTGKKRKLNNPTIALGDSYECPNAMIQLQVEKPAMPTNSSAENERASQFAARITINSDHNFKVEQLVENVSDSGPVQRGEDANTFIENGAVSGSLPHIESSNGEQRNVQINKLEPDNSEIQTELLSSLILDQECIDALKMVSQYSVSQRGAVQIIVSRRVYCAHHSARRGRKRRWRCLDYRRARCPAFIDTYDSRIVLRKGNHNHGYHDSQIYKKHKDGKIFNSIKQAEEARDYVEATCDDLDVENAVEFSVIPTTAKPSEITDE